jgi:hypothetical protein
VALSAINIPRQDVKLGSGCLVVTHDVPAERQERFLEIVNDKKTNVRGISVWWGDTCVRPAKEMKPNLQPSPSRGRAKRGPRKTRGSSTKSHAST